MCGNLWMSEDGRRVFTKCGNVFRTSEVRSEDMTYNGKLSETNNVQFVAHSAGINKILAIPSNSYMTTADVDTQIQTYGYDYLSYESSIVLPSFNVNGKSYPGHGRFVFFNNSGSRFYVVLQADPQSGMLNDYAIVVYSSDSSIPQGRTENLYFSQFANGQDFVSELTLTNPSDTSVAGAGIFFYDDLGNPLALSINGAAPAGSMTVSIPPFGAQTLATSGKGPLVAGSIAVSGDLPLGGVVRFKYPGLGVAGVGSNAVSTGFIAPVARSIASGRNTGIAITAVSSSASLILVLRDQNGGLISGGQTSIVLPERGHLARFLDELFPSADTAQFEGTVTATVSNGAFVTGVVLEIGAKPGEFTTMPVTPLH